MNIFYLLLFILYLYSSLFYLLLYLLFEFTFISSYWFTFIYFIFIISFWLMFDCLCIFISCTCTFFRGVLGFSMMCCHFYWKGCAPLTGIWCGVVGICLWGFLCLFCCFLLIYLCSFQCFDCKKIGSSPICTYHPTCSTMYWMILQIHLLPYLLHHMNLFHLVLEVLFLELRLLFPFMYSPFNFYFSIPLQVALLGILLLQLRIPFH